MIGTIRVMLADDHAVLRAGLRALLNAQPDIEVVGEAANGDEAIRHLTRHYPQVRTLVLTMHSEEQFILGAIKAGSSGYVLKSDADVELINAIRTVSSGELYYDRHAMQLLLEYHTGNTPDSGRTETLSEREHEVLVLTAQGYSSREIGERLFISAKTVDTYRQRLMTKLGLRHRADLVQYAIRNRLLEAPRSEQQDRPPDLGEHTARVHTAERADWQRTADVIVVGSGTGLMAALRAGDAARLGRALVNDLQEPALHLRPQLRRTLETGLDYGALGAIVSGSGPTCAFLVASEAAAVDLCVALTADGVVRTARPAHGPVPGARLLG